MVRKVMGVVLVTAIACGASLSAGERAGAQEAAQAAAGAVTPADAAPFMGDWTLAVQGPNGPGTFGLTVKTDQDKVVGLLTSEQSPPQTITAITRKDKSLVMNYTFDYQGMAIDAVLTLAQEPDKMGAYFSFASGAYEMAGTATKKDAK